MGYIGLLLRGRTGLENHLGGRPRAHGSTMGCSSFSLELSD